MIYLVSQWFSPSCLQIDLLAFEQESGNSTSSLIMEMYCMRIDPFIWEYGGSNVHKTLSKGNKNCYI